MTRKRLIAFVGLVVVLLGLGWFVLRRGAGKEADAEPVAVASVTLAPVRSGPVEDVVSAYGLVQADPNATTVLAAPKAAIVLRVLVRSGQPVSAGQVLAEVANTPAAEQAYRQALEAVKAGTADLARVQRLYDQHLAASDQLIAAEKTLADARTALSAQEKQGAGLVRQRLAAPTAGVVTNVAAVSGDHLAQDAAVVTLVRQGAATVKLALEPSGGRFAAGQSVVLTPAFGGERFNSRLTMVGRAADQTTKTVDAVAKAPPGLPIGAAMKGEVVTGTHDGLLVPRACVVFDETGPHVFVISGGHAHRLFVKVGGDHGDWIEVIGALSSSSAVALQGAYELQDGMAVRVIGR